jgi:hypothetical protein
MNAIMLRGSVFAVLVFDTHCPAIPKKRTVTMLNNEVLSTVSADEAVFRHSSAAKISFSESRNAR